MHQRLDNPQSGRKTAATVVAKTKQVAVANKFEPGPRTSSGRRRRGRVTDRVCAPTMTPRSGMLASAGELVLAIWESTSCLSDFTQKLSW